MATTINQQKTNTVRGKVTDNSGRPLANLKVAIYDIDMREWQALDDTFTNKEGKYELTWTHDQLSGRGKKEADIAVKVFTKEKNAELFKSSIDEVRFNASEREEINIIIRQDMPKELVEFDFLVKEVSFLANKVAIADLQENKKHRDVTFLSKEMEVPVDKIVHLVVAHRLHNLLKKIDAAFFYALLRKNTFLHNDFTKNLNARLSIGMGVDDQTLLYDAALTDSKRIDADIRTAAKEKIVSPGTAKNVKHNLEILSQYRKKAEEYFKSEHPQKAINLLTNFFKEGKLQEIQKLFEENKNDLARFFDKVTDPSFYATKEKEKDAKTNIALGKLFGFGNEIIPQIAKSQGIKKPEDARKLAKLNKAGWVEAITKARPDDEDKQSISTYASAIVRKMENEFPTLAFAAQLERAKQPVLKNQDKIVSFFNKHEDFDLMKHNVDLYLKERKVAKKENEAIKEELKSVQRVFKLVPNYSKTLALREEKIHSAQSIVAIGETRFVKEVAPKAGIEEKEAKEIFRKAETNHTAAMLMVGDLQDSMSVMDIASFETTTLTKKLEAVSKDFPNLKSLFKLTDTCECEHCRSVYSPAAYLVEIIEFLENRSVVDLTVPAPPPPNIRPSINVAKKVLFDRRSDLGEIDLGCANANTPVKYIDLVCEILEEAIAPNSHFVYAGKLSKETNPLKGKISTILLAAIKTAQIQLTDPITGNPISLPTNYQISDKALVIETGIFENGKPVYYLRDKNIVFKIVFELVNAAGDNEYKVKRLRQTFGTAQELDAAPEYVNESAYHELRNKAYAFKLPFDLKHTEAKAYFSRFDVNRADLMKAFKSAGIPSDESIAAERLGLTDVERKIIVNTPIPNDNAAQQDYWNVPAPGNVVDYLKQVGHFLDRTGLTYKELDLLLKLKFIKKSKNLSIKALDSSCDTEQKEIANLDLDVLDRIHRFLRLQKKTGWKYEVLDEIISQTNLGNGQLNDICLIKAAQLKEISEKTNIKFEELMGFYGEIPQLILLEDAPKPLYHQVFLNKAKNGVINDELLPEKVDGSQLLNTHISYIATCLQLKQKDLELITPLLPDNNLTFSNLSFLFAASRLIKKLKLGAEDFAIIQKLGGIDFSSSPDKTLEFLKVIVDFKDSPLKATDVRFILNHEATNLNDREIKIDKIEELLKKLKEEYEKIIEVQKSKFDNTLSAVEQKETLRGVLSGLKGKENISGDLSYIKEDEVKILAGFLDGNWKFKYLNNSAVEIISNSVVDASVFLNDKLDGVINISSIAASLNPLNNAIVVALNANTTQEAAKVAIENAHIAINTATSPAESVAAHAQLAAAEAHEVLTSLAAEAANNSFDDKRAKLVKAFLDEIANSQIQKGKHILLEQTLSTGFKLDLGLAGIILQYVKLKQLAPGTNLISDLLSDNFDNAITEVNYAKQYAALRLLHKIAALLNAFKLPNTDVECYLRNNADPALGWFEIDSIPYDAGQTAIAFSKYLEFSKIVSYSKQFTAVTNPLDAEKPISFFTIADIVLLGAAANRDEFLNKLALLTGYEKEDLDAIDAYLFAAFDIANYKNPENWKRVFECADYAKKLGATVAQIKQYIKNTLTISEVSDLRATLKSRYDEDTWLSTLKEIMDSIRPQKRNALVAYLLATNPEMKDENDLLDYFLVDVEMESCMPSSRIVQAHGTIQLFVQRCLMGLEPKAAADLNNDKNWNQWKWMKNYRVWEANRKVFLYPENWIEGELRDDKSFLFTELENELQQNELNDYNAEQTLIKYVEKLDNIAFLEVMASWYQTDIKTMHTIARTKGGDPAIYYYRRFEKESYWTPWEKVDLDITGDHLLAFVRNNRLYLAWPVFSEEPDPNPKATIPNNTANTEVDLDKPKRKIKIQLAISEFANNNWQPKKVSKDAIKTPQKYYTKGDIPREKFKFFFNQIADQIVVFDLESIWVNENSFKNPISHFVDGLVEEWKYFEKLAGAFDIAGCKGYPELADSKPFYSDFIPIFLDTELWSQRYLELGNHGADFLFAQNVHAFLSKKDWDEILYSTPGTFRITYPHQLTLIDIVVLLFEYFNVLFNSSEVHGETYNNRQLNYKFPLGTLLPYFMEDSNHAYVIIPGFYKKVDVVLAEITQTYKLTDEEKRTGSNVLELIEEIFALQQKYAKKFIANPSQDINLLFKELITDKDFQKIMTDFKAFEGLEYGEQFKNMYHPLVCYLRTILYKSGIPELMKRETQLHKNILFDFNNHYKPNSLIVPQAVSTNEDGIKALSYPIEDLDFSSDGSYSVYNWELFFHVPFLIATHLTKNQRFEEALTWFHYMFNPTGALNGSIPQKYWVTKPFYLNQEADYISQRIDSLLYTVAGPESQIRKNLEFAIDEWRSNPFKPHVVARFRPVAYQKALLMKYIDNLTEWGDYLFRQDTMESVAQATQMYILADKLLGPKPRIIPASIKQQYETYNQIEAKLDKFGNALIELENILPDLSVLPEGGNELPASPATLSMLYFCIPQNDKMMEYWDRIADRLFKIRHCQNIDGIERNIALFAPPIDPALLVRAAASGLDISAVLAGLNAPTPYYRFNILSQKATELAQEVRGLGNSLLQALEKKDAEALTLLRSELELKVLNAVKDIKKLQINESKEQIEVLKRTKKVTEERHKYYAEIEYMNALEITSLVLNGVSIVGFTIGSIMEMTAGGAALAPDVTVGASGFGGSPVAVTRITGGEQISSSVSSFAKAILLASQILDKTAGGISTMASYQRRNDDWKLQERMAKLDLNSIKKQIVAAEIRKEIAEKDLKNHELQIDNAKKSDEFMRSKFTNKELYNWMIGQISSVYFSAYKLAHDFAKKAERCYRFELGNDDSYISYGYWDSMKKGLQSADHLIHDIKRMETSYLDKNKREYEITKHVSLSLLDPLALLSLRTTGACYFEIPEVLYDMDHPGQYFRRLKSVSVSIPCIAGPYTSVSAKLSLISNKYRKNTNPGAGYAEDPGKDDRFTYNVGTIQSIAASNSQNDSGLFELNFRDERYLPFENTGTISSWRLELPTEVQQFDYNTISDVVMHIKYTAREGGSGLKTGANDAIKVQLDAINQGLKQNGLHVAINLKHDLPNEWQILSINGKVDLKIDYSRLPYMAMISGRKISEVIFVAKVQGNPSSFALTIDTHESASTVAPTNFSLISELKLLKGINSDIDLDKLFTLSVSDTDKVKLEELLLIVKFKF